MKSNHISFVFDRPKNYSFLCFMIYSRYKNGNIKPFNKVLVALKDSYLKVGINNLLARQSLFEPNTFLSWFFVELTSKFCHCRWPKRLLYCSKPNTYVIKYLVIISQVWNEYS